jgi:chromatin segregation and condensation protein Rec8/ScpA/Scc1 (kleisin family)
MVNELHLDSDDDDENDEETREAIGDQSSSTTKWHKHTVKVLQLLQRRMLPTKNDDDEEEKPTEVAFQDISHNCNRRTAASVFFETLQLKTWDFIEVEQDEEYGSISITPGVRFQEAPPNN